MASIRVLDHDDVETPVNIEDKTPDTCPLCHHGIHAIERARPRYSGGYRWVERVFQCPRTVCSRLFIGRYCHNHRSDSFMFTESVPVVLEDLGFPDEVRKISSDFCDIYSQAEKAEQSGWLLVAGPGYRKSLEFLMKDYLCSLTPEDAEKIEKIKKMPLADCINNYAKDPRVKSMAARAAWLGNDETHYTRKWEGKDLQDLKRLIDLTLNWIHAEELTQDIVADMPGAKK